jgi:hypothetical protein
MIDMTGTKFGKLTAIEYRGSGLWLFRCDCGNEKVISGYDARRGRTRSCGCLLKELIRNKNIANRRICKKPCLFTLCTRRNFKGTRIQSFSRICKGNYPKAMFLLWVASWQYNEEQIWKGRYCIHRYR